MDKLQQSFSGGVIEPGLHHRVDLQNVAFGLKTSQNAVISQNGNWATRPGTRYFGKTVLPSGDTSKKSILIDFPVDDVKYLIEITEGKTRLINYDLSPLTYPIYHSLSGWFPYGHRNRPAYGAYSPYQLVRVGKSWVIQYNGIVKSPYFYLYANETDGDCTGLVITAQVNSSDNLEVTTPGGTLLIKFASTTPSKNSPALIEEAIQESGALSIDGGIVMGFSSGWVKASSDWDGDFSSYSGLGVTVNHSHGIRQLNATATDYLLPTFTPESIIEFSNPYFEEDLNGIKFERNYNSVYFAHGKYRPYIIEFRDAHSYYFGPVSFLSEPSDPISKSATISGGFGSVWKLRDPAFDLSMISDYKIRVSAVIGQVDSNVEYPNNHHSDPLPSSGQIFYSVSGTIVTPTYGLLRIEYTLDGSNWIDSGEKLDYGSTGYFDYGSPVHFRLNNVSGNTHNVNLKVSKNNYSGYGTVTGYGDSWSDTWAVVTPNVLFPFTSDNSANVQYSPWLESNGFPETVYFFQNRLGFAATKKYPSRRWESKINDFYTFNCFSSIVADDPLDLNLPCTKPERIKNILNLQEMIILTDMGVWAVITDNNGYGPLNIPITQKITTSGASSIAPITAGQSMIFSSKFGNELYAFRFDNLAKGYVSMPISDHAKHLFNGVTIEQMVYQEIPIGIIWIRLSSGKVISLTFSDKNSIVAFSYHDFGGFVEDILVYAEDSDKLFLIINRNNTRYIETLDFRDKLNENGFYSVDCGLIYESETPFSTVSGLERFHGAALSAISDGWPLTTISISNGVISLPKQSNSLSIGFSFSSIFESIRQFVDSNNGSGLTSNNPVSAVRVLYGNTCGGEFGYNEDTLFDMPNRNIDPSIPESLFSAWVRLPIHGIPQSESTWSDSRFYYVQKSPYPAQILAIISEIN